jgi:hypothetical protein
MNLRGIANGATRAVNPNIEATVQVSAGYETRPDGTRVAKFAELAFTGQVQALQYNDMVHLDGLNIQGIRRAIYLNGTIDSLNRINKKGGDLIKIATGPNAGVWLVALVLEQWPDWAKCAVTLQDQAAG